GQQFRTLAAAVAASHDGDTIQVQAGTYVNDFATINTKISIVGVGGMVNLVATVPPPNGKAILVVDNDVTLDHIDFSGCHLPVDQNGAGIRFENGNLAVTNCAFHDNDMGILTAPGNMQLTVTNSEFYDQNIAGGGLAHDLYAGVISRLEVAGCYFHDSQIGSVGHHIKSRAAVSYIHDNII